jgi:hypothetical protein
MVAGCNVALVHYSWSIRLWKLGLLSLAILPSASIGTSTYNAVPQSAIVPKNNVLLLMSMCVDILWRQHGTHDPTLRLGSLTSIAWVKTYLCINALTSFKSSTTRTSPSGLSFKYSLNAPCPWTCRLFSPVLGFVHTIGYTHTFFSSHLGN